MTANTASAKKSAYTKCQCSEDCSATTRNLFAQGHDARLVSRLVTQVMAKEGTFAQFTLDSATRELGQRGGTANLRYKLETAVQNAQDKRVRKATNTKAPRQSRTGLTREQVAEGIRDVELEVTSVAAETAIEPVVVRAKVGRWTYEGTLAESSEGMAFTYQSKLKGTQTTTKFTLVEQ